MSERPRPTREGQGTGVLPVCINSSRELGNRVTIRTTSRETSSLSLDFAYRYRYAVHTVVVDPSNKVY